MIASYPGLPSQLFSQPWKSVGKLVFTAVEKSCEGRPGYEASLVNCRSLSLQNLPAVMSGQF